MFLAVDIISYQKKDNKLFPWPSFLSTHELISSYLLSPEVHRMSKRGLNQEQQWLGSCLRTRKNSRVRQMQESESESLKMKVRTNSENKRVMPRKSRSGVCIPPGAGIGDILLTGFIDLLLLARTLHFPLFLPYLVPLELSWHQIHDGNHSNCNANEIIMTL